MFTTSSTRLDLACGSTARKRFRATGYDLTINEFHSHSWQLALLVAASGAPYRLGHVTSPGWTERFSRYSFIFNMPVRMREDEHEIDRYLDLVRAADARKINLDEARTFIHLTGEDREFAKSFFDVNCSDRIIGVQPGTSPAMRWKQWPVERYRVVIERLLQDHTDSQIVLFGSPGEAEMIEDLARGLGSRVCVAAGKTTVKQVAALIERCDALISNDSGLMHVAVAVGTPVIADLWADGHQSHCAAWAGSQNHQARTAVQPLLQARRRRASSCLLTSRLPDDDYA